MFERLKGLLGRRSAGESSVVAAEAPQLLDGYVQLCQGHASAGRFDAARDAVEQGLRSLPDAAPLHLLQANLHLQAGAFDAAEAAYRHALELQPDWPEAYYNRALAARAAGRLDDAAAHLAQALELRPDYVAAALVSAQLHFAAGHNEAALADYSRVLAIDPDRTDALAGRAAQLLRLDRPEDALVDLDRVLTREQGRADVWSNRAVALLRLDRPQEALDAARRAGREAAADAPFLNDLGLLLRELGDLDAALTALEQAVTLRPGFAAALSNRGLVLQELHRPEPALRDLDAALLLDPVLADAHANRGNVLQELERHDEALQAYARAFEIKPDLEDAYLNESLSRLVTGDLPGGWSRYEWRWHSSRVPHPKTQFTQPMWDGRQPLSGKTIFLYAEQGLGDTIQFCRYAVQVKALGATVILGVQAPLVPLLRGLRGTDEVIAQGEQLPWFDYHCPLLSLPGALATSLATIPAGDAYIGVGDAAFQKRRQAWRDQLEGRPAPRIGVVWSGNPNHKNDRNRSIPLSLFRRLTTVHASFICLQNDVREADSLALRESPEITFVGPQLIDFAATAALVAELDLVISVDTSVAHLAAAMGKPTWILLPTNPDWRWLLGRPDSPWYPTVRLFRQSASGDWGGVLDRVAEALRGFVATHA